MLFDLFDFFFHLTCWLHLCGATDQFPLEVDGIEQNGYLCVEGNVVEPAFPLRVSLSGALGCDAEAKFVCLLCFGRENFGEAEVLVAIDWYASPPFEDRSEWPEEPLALHQEVGVHTFGTHEELTNDEIPVAGVWGHTEDAFLRLLNGDVFLPSHAAVEQPSEEFSEHSVSWFVCVDGGVEPTGEFP